MAKEAKAMARLIAVMDDWPKAWQGDESDIPVGEALLQVMRPFVESMIAEGLTRGTIGRHLNWLWLLGGEIVRAMQEEPKLKRQSGEQLILQYTDEEGGLYSRHLHSEEEQRRFDATCRKLHRFLVRSGKNG